MPRRFAAFFVLLACIGPSSGCATFMTPKSDYEAPSEANKDVDTKMNGWIWGNLVWGPFFFVGVVVDAVTGAAHRYPESTTPTIESDEPAPSPETIVRVSAVKVPVPPPERPRRTTESGQETIIAVMELRRLRGTHPEDEVLRALEAQVRVYLAERGLRVVDRGQQSAHLAEEIDAAQRDSYESCVDLACQIPLGRALAATHLLRGSVARFGQKCATNGELVDLTREVTVAAHAIESSCGEEDLLEAAGTLATRLARTPLP